MSDQNFRSGPIAGAQSGAAIDQGLRAFMLRVYNYMLLGMALTGGTAYLVANSPQLLNLMFTVQANGSVGMSGLGWVVFLAPLALVLVLSFGFNRLSAGVAQVLFWVYATLVGASLSVILLSYTGESVALTFFVTAATFGAMSLWGYTTGRDLTGMGSFLMMGLFGLIIAMFANIFLHSSGLQFAISVIGVLIFTGLTAYDTQRIKESYSAGADGQLMKKTAVMGALRLYLDFLNLFLYLLQFLGNRR